MKHTPDTLMESMDQHRVGIHRLGWPETLLWRGYPPWARTLIVALLLWSAVVPMERLGIGLSDTARLVVSLVIGLLMLRTACDVLVTATERWAARYRWDHYVAGSLSELLSTVPELIVICFIVPVSPLAAMVVALVTIYNNALVFSVYSFFLPKNQEGRYLMPIALTDVGTKVLIAGAGLGSVVGLVMLVSAASTSGKQGFSMADLTFLGVLMLGVFAVYMYKLISGYAREEMAVCEALNLGPEQLRKREEHVYGQVRSTSLGNIVGLFFVGVVAAFLGAERVGEFAYIAIREIEMGPVTAAVLLAAFAGMSEYVILWKAHRKKQYGIALANAFGGITQVMFLVLPFTFLAIAVYQGTFGGGYLELPILFTLSNMLLFVLLFPTLFVLIELIAEDHTLGILDTTIMFSIYALILAILISYGNAESVV